MASQVFDARFPWILIDRDAPVGVTMTDTRTDETVLAPTTESQWAFLADRSANRAGHGLGDRVHQALDWAGFRRCVPCSKRQALLNSIGQVFGS